MPNNIVPGVNFLTASASATWADVGFNTSNVIEVYTTNNGNPQSWRPNKTINTLNTGGIVAGQGYQVNATTAMDKTAFFGAGGDDPAVFSSIFKTP